MVLPNLLLLSSSRIPADQARLHYAQSYIVDFLQGATQVTFVPYAGVMGADEYVGRVRPAFEAMGLQLGSVHEERDPVESVRCAKALCVGGGNTHLLNRSLHRSGLREVIRKRVLEDGVPYIGWSAGSNVAFGGIDATNDMNIVSGTNFQGLGLIQGPLRLNPHFADALRVEDLPEKARRLAEEFMAAAPEVVSVLNHQGETRERRIEEYLFLQKGPVIGLYEGGILLVQGERMTLTGVAGARVFRKDKEPAMYEPGSDLSFLLRE